jgi:hypothetical protein
MSTRVAEPPEELLAAEERPDDPTEITLVPVGRLRRGGLRAPAWLRGVTPAWIWIGLAVAAIGFVLLAIAWGQVAGETEVYLQIPYLVSAAFVGVGVILVGLTALVIATKEQEAIAHRREVDELLAAIDELRQSLVLTRGGDR